MWARFDANRSGPEHRRHGRLSTEPVRCDLGEVVDVSASGMRVRGRGRVPIRDGLFSLEVTGYEGPFTVPARIIRTTRKRWRRYELGIEFAEVDAAAKEHLMALVRAAMVRRWIAA